MINNLPPDYLSEYKRIIDQLNVQDIQRKAIIAKSLQPSIEVMDMINQNKSAITSALAIPKIDMSLLNIDTANLFNMRQSLNMPSILIAKQIAESLSYKIDFDTLPIKQNIIKSLNINSSLVAPIISMKNLLSTMQPIVAPLNIPSDEYIKNHPKYNEVKSILNKHMIETFAPPSYKETLFMKVANLLFFASYSTYVKKMVHFFPFIRNEVLSQYLNSELETHFNSSSVLILTTIISLIEYQHDNNHKDTDK